MLQLYPELQGSQEFHPGKSSLFFLSLENSASTPLIAAAVHTHIHFHTVLHVKTDTVFCRVLPTPPNPVLPFVGQPKQQIQPSLELVDQTKSAAQGWLGSSHRGSGLAPECMAADTTRHVSSDSLTPSPIFSLCLFPFYFPSLILASYFHSISYPLPSSFRLLMPYSVRTLGL